MRLTEVVSLTLKSYIWTLLKKTSKFKLFRDIL